MPTPVSFGDIRLSYGDVTALDGLSAKFTPGLNVVLGPNGAGKTTLFRIGAGILPPDSGTVTIDGTDPFADQSIKTRIGYLPHGTPLNGQLTVRENLEYWGRILGLEASTRTERIDQTAASMAIDDLLDRPATALSRGQRQRVTISRMLLSEPTVLFLDEPTTGLDPSTAKSLRSHLDALAAEGRTLCYSTHNLYEADLLADELTIIKSGRIVAQGPKDTLMNQIRGDGTREIRIQTDASAGTFEAIGVNAHQVEDGWIVTLPADQSVSDLIEALVEQDVAIERVHETEASLEDLYGQLTEDTGGITA